MIFSLRTTLYNRQLFIRIAVVNGIDVMSLSENLLSHGFENRDDSFLLEFLFYFFFSERISRYPKFYQKLFYYQRII